MQFLFKTYNYEQPHFFLYILARNTLQRLVNGLAGHAYVIACGNCRNSNTIILPNQSMPRYTFVTYNI